MNKPPVMILRTAGTNCDLETAFAFEQAGAVVEAVHVKALCADPDNLNNFKILAVPGGFSYGDDLGSGVVLAHEIMQRLGDALNAFVEKGGLILGICNGFQVLVKAGLLPGRVGELSSSENSSSTPSASLAFNDSRRFEDRWTTLKVGKSESPFLQGMEGSKIEIPVAHAEGKFCVRDKDTLDDLVCSNQVAFRYVKPNHNNGSETSNDESEQTGGSCPYPYNPNGSEYDIAGITDKTGRVLGMMPHPERHVLPWHHPRWTREGLKEKGAGAVIFTNAVKYASSI